MSNYHLAKDDTVRPAGIPLAPYPGYRSHLPHLCHGNTFYLGKTPWIKIFSVTFMYIVLEGFLLMLIGSLAGGIRAVIYVSLGP